jgi:hypothetical protein
MPDFIGGLDGAFNCRLPYLPCVTADGSRRFDHAVHGSIGNEPDVRANFGCGLDRIFGCLVRQRHEVSTNIASSGDHSLGNALRGQG